MRILDVSLSSYAILGGLLNLSEPPDLLHL